MRSAVDGFEVLRDRLGGTRDERAGDRRLVPDGAAFVHLGDREVERVAKLVLERADDLPAVLERLRVRDGELESQSSDGHCLFSRADGSSV
jgi:hypothetical protein